ncbi:MAG: hypothetical protein HQL99_03220 [Magnetococcales bacterium]|nr:hypothetical protein [Magnetococcales bacterium]
MEEFAMCSKELDDPRTGNAGQHDPLELFSDRLNPPRTAERFLWKVEISP